MASSCNCSYPRIRAAYRHSAKRNGLATQRPCCRAACSGAEQDASPFRKRATPPRSASPTHPSSVQCRLVNGQPDSPPRLVLVCPPPPTLSGQRRHQCHTVQPFSMIIASDQNSRTFSSGSRHRMAGKWGHTKRLLVPERPARDRGRDDRGSWGLQGVKIFFGAATQLRDEQGNWPAKAPRTRDHRSDIIIPGHRLSPAAGSQLPR